MTEGRGLIFICVEGLWVRRGRCASVDERIFVEPRGAGASFEVTLVGQAFGGE